MSDGAITLTFEDWKEGQFPQPSEIEEIAGEISSKKTRPEHELPLHYYLDYTPPILPKVELRKIRESQKRAYLDLLERNVNIHFEYFKEQCKNAPAERMPDIIEREIKKMEEEFSNEHLLQRVRKRNFNFECITPDDVHEIQGGSYFCVCYPYYYKENPHYYWNTNLNKVVDRFTEFAYAELYEYVEKLKSLLKYYQTDDSSTKKKKGYHKENKTWINETYLRVRSDCNSDHAAVMKVKSLYEHKFGSISKSTVYRLVGLVRE